jgi:hypothetical protein
LRPQASASTAIGQSQVHISSLTRSRSRYSSVPSPAPASTAIGHPVFTVPRPPPPPLPCIDPSNPTRQTTPASHSHCRTRICIQSHRTRDVCLARCHPLPPIAVATHRAPCLARYMSCHTPFPNPSYTFPNPSAQTRPKTPGSYSPLGSVILAKPPPVGILARPHVAPESGTAQRRVAEIDIDREKQKRTDMFTRLVSRAVASQIYIDFSGIMSWDCRWLA